MQGDPPFSRRRSPNRPSPNSIPATSFANQRSIQGISKVDFRQGAMCAYDSRLRGEGRGEGASPQAQTRGEAPSPGICANERAKFRPCNLDSRESDKAGIAVAGGSSLRPGALKTVA